MGLYTCEEYGSSFCICYLKVDSYLDFSQDDLAFGSGGNGYRNHVWQGRR